MYKLQSNSHIFLTENVLENLSAKNIKTVVEFIRCDNRFIEQICSLTYPEITEVKTYLRNKYCNNITNAIINYKETLKNTVVISFGIDKLDSFFKGGFMTGYIYEICGPPVSGKTLFTLKFIRSVLKTENQVYFLDSKSKFSAKLMKLLINQSDQNILEQMKNLMVKRIETKYELIAACHDIKNQLKNTSKIKVIVLDSLPTLFLNSKNHFENNMWLNHLSNIIKYIAQEHHVVVLIINLLTYRVDGNFNVWHSTKENTLCGKYWQGIPNFKLKLKRVDDKMEIDLIKGIVFGQKSCTINFKDLV